MKKKRLPVSEEIEDRRDQDSMKWSGVRSARRDAIYEQAYRANGDEYEYEPDDNVVGAVNSPGGERLANELGRRQQDDAIEKNEFINKRAGPMKAKTRLRNVQ